MMGLLVSAAPGVELKLKWENGKRYVFEQKMSSAVSLSMGGVAIETASDMTQEMHYDVAAHEDGTEVKFSFESVKMDVSMNGQQQMSFDSTAEDGGGPAAAMMAPVLEMEASVIYDEEGEVVAVKGLDGLQGMEQLGMGKDTLEQMMTQASLLMPGGDMKPGDEWERKIEMPLGQLSKVPAVSTFKLKFEGMEEREGKQLAMISVGGSVSMGGEGEEAPPISLESKKMEGVMFFDAELGQLVESKMEMDLEMGLPAGVPVAEDAPEKFPMSVVTLQKLKSVEEVK